MDGKEVEREYKEEVSELENWDERGDEEEYMVYGKNMGYEVCIEERGLSKGDVYRMLINRDKGGRKGCIIGVIEGSKRDDMIGVVRKMGEEVGNEVKEIRVDMGGRMEKIGKRWFGGGMEVIDRFDVEKVV